MKFEKLTYVAVSAAVIIALILLTYISTPIANNSVQRVKKIYYVDNISSAHQKVIDRFNKKYQGQIEVEAINLSFDKFSTNERKELLARYLRSKSDRIDVFAVDQIWVPRFAKWGIPFDKHLTESQKDGLLSSAVTTCIYKDTLVAIPLYIDIGVMFYRSSLLNKLSDSLAIKEKLNSSITWDDFLGLQKRLNKNNYFLFPADDYEGLLCVFIEMLASRNKDLVTRKEIKFNTPEGEEVLQLLVNFVNKYKITPSEVAGYKENEAYSHFMDHDGSFVRGWPAFLFDKEDSGLSIAPTPHFEGREPRSIFGGWNLMISKFTSRVPESVKFINFLISSEAQKIMYEEGRYLPIINSMYEDKEFIAANPELKFYRSLMNNGIHRPFIEDYTNLSDVLAHYLNLAIKGKMGVKEALSAASDKINSGSILLK